MLATRVHFNLENAAVVSGKSDLIDLSDGVVAGETDKEFRFVYEDKTVGLPKSQCEWDPDGRVMTLPEWLAVEKGLV